MFDYTFHRGNRCQTTTCPVRNSNLVCRGEYSVSGWKICDLDLEDTHYKSPRAHERLNSLYPDFPTVRVYLNLSHSNDITEYSGLQQDTALIHGWCGWPELLESSVCLWQKVRPAPEIATFSSSSYGWLFCAKEGFMRKLTKQISFELFSRWIIYTEADGLLSKLKKKFNSFRVVPAHQLSSCDVGSSPGVRAYGSAQVPFSLPGRKWQIQ